jgi:hypothetical protein
MTEEEKIDEAREIFKASRKAYTEVIDEKLNEVIEMIQGEEAVDKYWLGSPPPELQSIANTIRLYRPNPITVPPHLMMGQSAPVGSV